MSHQHGVGQVLFEKVGLNQITDRRVWTGHSKEEGNSICKSVAIKRNMMCWGKQTSIQGAEVSFMEVVGDEVGRVGWGQNLGPLMIKHSSDSILRHWDALTSVLILG